MLLERNLIAPVAPSVQHTKAKWRCILPSVQAAARVPAARPIENNIRKLIAIQVLGSFQFHQPVFVLLYTGVKGFSLQEFFLLQSVSSAITLLLEIPTGSFSDRVSHRRSLLIGSLIGVSTTLVVILSDSFWAILAAAAVGGVGAAFSSGADSAIFYDSLAAAGRDKEFVAVSGRVRWYGGWAMAVAGIAGGGLAHWGVPSAWWAWLAVSVLSLLLTATLTDPPARRTARRQESYLNHLRASWRWGTRGQAGLFVTYAAIMWLFFSIGYWLWQPYLRLTGVPAAWFGVVYFAMNVVGGLSSRFAHPIRCRIGVSRSLVLIPLLLAAGFLLESRVLALYGCCFLALHSAASGYFGPVLDDAIHARLPAERRATILSMKNMLSGLLFSVFSPLVGYHADVYSLPATLFLMGGTLALAALVLWFILPDAADHFGARSPAGFTGFGPRSASSRSRRGSGRSSDRRRVGPASNPWRKPPRGLG